MGAGRAVSYVGLTMADQQRRFVVSVTANSMKPVDDISKNNMAMERWNNKAIDPISYMKEINSSDPMEDAKKLVIWSINPQMYLQMYFPEAGPVAQPMPGQEPQGAGEPGGNQPGELSAPSGQSSLSSVPISAGVAQP